MKACLSNLLHVIIDDLNTVKSDVNYGKMRVFHAFKNSADRP